jgi:uncharacterized damage-inducible protein DinB
MSKKPAKKKHAKAKATKPVKKSGKKLARKPVKKAASKSAPVATPAKARALSGLQFARKVLTDVVKSIPEDKATWQGAPTDNHLIWTLGHLAQSNQWFANLLDGKPNTTPEGYEALFGYKSAPVNDPAAYPPLAEVRQAFEETFARLVAAAEATADELLSQPTVTDSGGFAKDRLHVLELVAWHEGWHAGQLSSLRRAPGLPPGLG